MALFHNLIAGTNGQKVRLQKLPAWIKPKESKTNLWADEKYGQFGQKSYDLHRIVTKNSEVISDMNITYFYQLALGPLWTTLKKIGV